MSCLPYVNHKITLFGSRFKNDKIDPLPSLSQIQNYVKRMRTPASAAFTDNQLRTYCELHSEVPDDPNKPYVLVYEVASTTSFFVIWTTGRLLQLQLATDQIQVAKLPRSYLVHPILGGCDFFNELA